MPQAIFRVTTVATLYGQTINNVLHFRGPSDDPAQMSVLAEEFVTNFLGHIRNMQVQDVFYSAIRVRMLESQYATFTKTTTLQGVNSADTQTLSFAAFVWKLRGATIGRHSLGRIYVGGIPSRVQTLGIIGSATIVAAQNRFVQIMGVYGPSGSSTFRLCIVPKNPPFTTTDVVSMDINPVVCVQRRRNIGVGV
jgi:hypothetical protein